MKKWMLPMMVAGLLTIVTQKEFNPLNKKQMKLNTGIITPKLQETKKFYQEVLGFGVTFENEWYILLHTPGHTSEIAFLQPDHPSQQPLFQPAFEGRGVFITIEVSDVDEVYEQVKASGTPVAIAIRDEPWGDRHFAIVDPNGIGVDIVTYRPQ